MRIHNKLRRYNKFKTNQSIYSNSNPTASQPQNSEHISIEQQKKQDYWHKLSKKKRLGLYLLTILLTLGFMVIVFN